MDVVGAPQKEPLLPTPDSPPHSSRRGTPRPHAHLVLRLLTHNSLPISVSFWGKATPKVTGVRDLIKKAIRSPGVHSHSLGYILNSIASFYMHVGLYTHSVKHLGKKFPHYYSSPSPRYISLKRNYMCIKYKQTNKKQLEKPNDPAQEKGFWIMFSASMTLAGSGWNSPRWSVCMCRRTCIVCRLDSQTQLLTVCLTPPIPMLPVFSTCHLIQCVKILRLK